MPPESAGEAPTAARAEAGGAAGKAGAAAPTAAGEPAGAARPPLVVRGVVAFGRFWWDFLVGDSPELLIGVLVALALVALLVKGPSVNAAGAAAFPVIVAVLLGLSVYRARPRR